MSTAHTNIEVDTVVQLWLPADFVMALAEEFTGVIPLLELTPPQLQALDARNER